MRGSDLLYDLYRAREFSYDMWIRRERKRRKEVPAMHENVFTVLGCLCGVVNRKMLTGEAR